MLARVNLLAIYMRIIAEHEKSKNVKSGMPLVGFPMVERFVFGIADQNAVGNVPRGWSSD